MFINTYTHSLTHTESESKRDFMVIGSILYNPVSLWLDTNLRLISYNSKLLQVKMTRSDLGFESKK